MEGMKAHPTKYRGILFRSRLEARWAAFFDKLGWEWRYEDEECYFDGWIADFVILCPRNHVVSSAGMSVAPDPVGNFLIEVKPERTVEGLKQHWDKISRSGCKQEVVIVGVEPLVETGEYGYDCGLGVLNGWDYASLIKCCKGHYGMAAQGGSYQCRICGFYDGDEGHGGFFVVGHNYGDRHDDALNEVRRFWNEAGNLTRFKAAEE